MSSISGGKPPFVGQRTFIRSKHQQDLSSGDIAVVGIPFDLATTNKPGARFGPEDIRNVSLRRCSGDNPRLGVDPAKELSIIDYGDFNLPFANVGSAIEAIYDDAFAILEQDAHMVSMGGDHSITLPLLRAHADKYGPVAIVHFDAHHDAWENNFGTEIAHGTWIHHAVEEGLIDTKHSVMLGVRCPGEMEILEKIESWGIRIFTADDIHIMGPDKIARRIKSKIKDTKAYLTFDVDGLDPSCAPGTGTPEPGGIHTWQALRILEKTYSLNWIGMDVVEVAPPYDVNQITSLAAASIIWQYLSGLARKKIDEANTPEDYIDAFRI